MKRHLIVILIAGGCVGAAGCHGTTQDDDGNVPPAQRSRQEVITYYDSGTRKEMVTFYRDGTGRIVRDGMSAEWYDNGQMWHEGSYKDGVKEGEWTHWHPGGAKARQGAYREGKKDGKWQAWQITGSKQWEAVYRDGKVEGKKTFWGDGRVVRVESYGTAGLLDTVEVWHSDGTRALSGEYSAGVRDGARTYWYPNGGIKAQGVWKEGKPWSGVCGVPVAGDAGSWGGIERFRLYRHGVDVGPASLPSASSAPATSGE